MDGEATGPIAVDEALSALLGEFPDPKSSDPLAFLSARFDLGLAWVHFALGAGGLGADRTLQEGVDRRLDEIGAPPPRGDFIGLHQVANTLDAIGSDQQRKLFLKRIFTGEDHWCQLFSEPGAGSDLAGLATSAIPDGDDWNLTGQKVWTSGAHLADFALTLARTNPDIPKHRGLTMFILDMRQAGIEVRPLRQADGGARFNEVFLTDARVPDSMRIGEVGDGWSVSLRVLQTERKGAADIFLRPVQDLIDIWHERQAALSPAQRDEVVRMWIEARTIAMCNLRAETCGRSDETSRLRSLSKIASSEHAQRLGNLMATLLGPASTTGIDYDAALQEDMAQHSPSPLRFRELPTQRFLLRTRAMSIEGGTNQIQRNIIGERVLGLPPDVRIDKDRPWREIPR